MEFFWFVKFFLKHYKMALIIFFEHKKRLRTMAGHAGRVSSLSWNSFICSRYVGL